VRFDAATPDDAATTNIPRNDTARRWRAGALATLGLALIGGVGATAATNSPEPKLVAAAHTVTVAAKTAPKKAAPAKTAPKKAAPAKAWVFPMHGRVTSCPGPRWGTTHQGMDVGDVGAKGGTPILAAAKGKVVQAGFNHGGYGNMVIIRHADGHHTLYGHAAKVMVRAGQSVKAGQKIALEGSTGHSTGPHLHFEVHKDVWNRVNPVKFLQSQGVSVKC
jgi:murein DD-endopeptidase MepM/ murein hydrolase activator NlpD